LAQRESGHSTKRQRAAGLSRSGVCGVAFANVVYFVLSATGIAALIIASNLVFSIIKWVGVAYLLWLGINALFSRSGVINVSVGKRQTHLGKLFSQGFIIELPTLKHSYILQPFSLNSLSPNFLFFPNC